MSNLHKKLDNVEHAAKASKLARLMENPIAYVKGIGYKNLIYRFTQQGWVQGADTFFDRKMWIELPAGMDIYLVRGKSHDSEIRLCRYLINTLKKGESFIDVGAHFGFFSLLASELVGKKGLVISFEPAFRNFRLLEKNTHRISNIEIHNKAIADKAQNLIFIEFPPLQSEYNTVFPEQFETEQWYQNTKAKRTKVEAVELTSFIISRKCKPNLIKIDVEGAEHLVIKGLGEYLTDHNPIIAMEFLGETRVNQAHLEAEYLLKEKGYECFAIAFDGSLKKIESGVSHLTAQHLSSDNIIFQKK